MASAISNFQNRFQENTYNGMTMCARGRSTRSEYLPILEEEYADRNPRQERRLAIKRMSQRVEQLSRNGKGMTGDVGKWKAFVVFSSQVRSTPALTVGSISMG